MYCQDVQCGLLGCDPVYSYRRNLPPPFSGLKSSILDYTAL
jgi:hypothetical protein